MKKGSLIIALAFVGLVFFCQEVFPPINNPI